MRSLCIHSLLGLSCRLLALTSASTNIFIESESYQNVGSVGGEEEQLGEALGRGHQDNSGIAVLGEGRLDTDALGVSRLLFFACSLDVL